MADGPVARVPHCLCRHRDGHARDDGCGGSCMAPHAAAGIPGSRQTLGTRDGDPVRRGRGVRDRPVARARAVMADVHGVRRPRHRHALFAGRLRVFSRGHLPGFVPVRLGQAASAGARICGRDGFAERSAVGSLRRYSERVDEHACGISPGRREGRGGRSIRGHVQSRRRSPGGAHAARRLRRGRRGCGGNPRAPVAACYRSPVSSTSIRHCVGRWVAGRAGPAGIRRLGGARSGKNATGQARCAGGPICH